MNVRMVSKLMFVFVVMAAVVATGYDAGKPITVKGYVLDSACAFTKGQSSQSARTVQWPARRRGLRW